MSKVQDAIGMHADQLDPSENFIGHNEFIVKDADGKAVIKNGKIVHRELTVEIAKLTKEKLPWQPRMAKPNTVVSFKDRIKRLKLNATNRRAIQKLYTGRTETWPGKELTLYWDPEVRNPSGGEPGGTRIRT